MMNKVVFDLDECGIGFCELKILLDKCNSNVMVNGFVLKWEYELIENVVEVTPRLLKL